MNTPDKLHVRLLLAGSVAALLLLTNTSVAREKATTSRSLEAYLRRLPAQASQPEAPLTAGSLWTDQGRLSDMAAHYKARRIGDLVTIVVVQSLESQNSGNVATDRSFKASSGIDALAGHISTTGVQNIFSPTSSQSLSGKAQSTSSSSLKTSLTGRVAAVLPNGMLVVEAEREINMNNERQTIVLRGLVRPGDLAPDNSVASKAIGNLELELKGKGVVSEGVRPPNTLVRWLLRVVGF